MLFACRRWCDGSVEGDTCAKMRIFLPLLSFLCATHVHGVFEGTCPKKEPPPGALVLSPGSTLVLTCRGHAALDGVKVNIARNSSNTGRRGRTSAAPTTPGNTISSRHTAVSEGVRFNREAEVSAVTGESRSPAYADTAGTAAPTTHVVRPTSAAGGLLKGEPDREAEEVDGEGDYEEDEEEEEGEEGSRVTRGIRSRPRWTWNERTLGSGKRDWGGITLERGGATLSLTSVRVTDSGMYACHHRGRERFSVKVIVAEPPESPSLFCYKRSPNSKIRCEWAPQRPVTRQTNSYLVLNRRPSDTFSNLQCSYSSRLSRYWCALDFNEDEMRTVHTAFLCVTNIAGNATSTLLHFTPLNILKPDPPSDVRAMQEEGHKRWIKVTWNFPISWKPQDRYYKLIYEVKYKPFTSSFENDQIIQIKDKRSCTVTDAMSGVQYLIEVRNKDEYDGQWSDWSIPVIASSWTDQNDDDLITTTFPVSAEEGSTTTDDNMADGVIDPEPVARELEVSHHILWVSGSFVFLSVILAAYMFRHKDRFMSKFHRIRVVIQSRDSSQLPPSAPAAPERQATVTFMPPRYKEPPEREAEEEEEENEEEHRLKERTEAMHFNNTSYFLIQRE